MPRSRYKNDLDSLTALAEPHEGYFRASDAVDSGIDRKVLARLADAGHLERPLLGVYRLARWPAAQHPDLLPIVLWAKGKDYPVAFSHRTALQLHGISDINPSRVDLTFPKEARFRGKLPRSIVIHRGDLNKGEIEYKDGLPITTLYRTLFDLIIDGLAHGPVDEVLHGGHAAKSLQSSERKTLLALWDLDRKSIQRLIDRGPKLLQGAKS